MDQDQTRLVKFSPKTQVLHSFTLLLTPSMALDHVQGRFDHPYLSFLFYGMDAAGDFIPIKQLREKYNRPRHEVPGDPPGEGGEDA